MNAMDTRTRYFVLASARIAAGLLWLANLHWKVAPNFGQDTGGGLYKYTRSAVDTPVWGVWKTITEDLILPHYHLFGWIVILTDGTLAALLLIGYRTRLVALIGAFNAIPIFLSVAYRERRPACHGQPDHPFGFGRKMKWIHYARPFVFVLRGG